MKSTRLYVVGVETNGKMKVSQEAYFGYEQAKNFIQSRSDKPQQVSSFLFESKENKYYIFDVFAHRTE